MTGVQGAGVFRAACMPLPCLLCMGPVAMTGMCCNINNDRTQKSGTPPLHCEASQAVRLRGPNTPEQVHRLTTTLHLSTWLPALAQPSACKSTCIATPPYGALP